MSEPAILNPRGIFKGQAEKGVQFYHVIGDDADGDTVILIFGCKVNFSDTVDKAFSRLFPVAFKPDMKPESKETIDITPKGDVPNET